MTSREQSIAALHSQTFDVLVVGGGINGAVSAAALSARGAKVALVERGDFAGETSSNSSNLVWGGIKYLENGELGLVNHLCRSRNRLMRAYPSTVKEIRFLATVRRDFRMPAFFIFLGTCVYWLFGRFVTQAPRYFSARTLNKREPLIDLEGVAGGVEYSDCYLYDNDARFVFNFVRDSVRRGCVAINYMEAVSARRSDGLWHVELVDRRSGEQYQVTSRVLINSCGPWVDRFNKKTAQYTGHHHLLSKGIHLIVDRLTANRRVLTFFASDGRMFFVIPMGPKTCIGTTDTSVTSPKVGVTEKDRQFVLDNVNARLKLKKPLSRDDIVAERCGVRPLAVESGEASRDWVRLSRKHALEVDSERAAISIFGGKLTDCLNVGDEVSALVAGLGIALREPAQCWYGEPGNQRRAAFLARAGAIALDAMTDPASSEPLTERLWRRYGERAFELLDMISADPREAQLLIENAEYLRCELRLAARDEMIVTLEDFLRRRSKIAQVVRDEDIAAAPGLREACEILFGAQAERRLQEYLQQTVS